MSDCFSNIQQPIIEPPPTGIYPPNGEWIDATPTLGETPTDGFNPLLWLTTFDFKDPKNWLVIALIAIALIAISYKLLRKRR